MKKILSFAAAFAASVSLSLSAQAAVVMNVFESGGDVVITAKGSLDLSGLAAGPNSPTGAGVNPTFGFLLAGGGSGTNSYVMGDSLGAFGISGFTGASSGSGALFGIGTSGGANVVVDAGASTLVPYVVDSIARFAGETFASLGITANDTRIVNLSNQDMITVIFGAAPSEVPVPAALPLFLAGLAGLGFAKRRRAKATA